ncbi:hypothetical protein SOASR030_16800 [Leminorella grimontii]|uniref:DUF1145 family protein n=1 Tax=Leminorella grimontii TaxID=82981 RepID=A0AAV5N3S5_9GAMM|nr:putative inner membrane protein [Leminorella grimontii ATCC 33999 = DSM 5078]GKX55568.1 hypothetical protein SOASR030_16800 [Leminorella grimontii]GKX59377.1 hypothetical protein SOASR031_16920 [Leminorella grimontii]
MKMKQLVINVGRLMMIGVWGFLLLNLFQPFPSPLKYFLYVAMGFTLFMHGLQLALLKSTLPKDGEKMSGAQSIRILLFGVFELLAWQQNQQKRR